MASKSKTGGSAYDMTHKDEPILRHIFAVFVDNEPGVLARVIGLFSGRGYNISSLTVTTVSEDRRMSRITIVTSGTAMVIDQIRAQLQRLVPVHEVHDLSEEGLFVERDIVLVRFTGEGHDRREALRIADIFRAQVADTTLESFVFQLAGSPDKVDAFIELLRALGSTEVVRSGSVAIARG